MKRVLQPLLTILLLGAMIYSYGFALIQSDNMVLAYNVQILYKEGPPLTGREGLFLLEQESQQEESLNVALWGVVKNQTVKFENFNREVSVDLIVVCGDSTLLFTTNYPLREIGPQEILISKDVALKLFGNVFVCGIVITYDGAEYNLRGIIEGAKNTAVIHATRNTEAVLDSAVLEIPSNRGQISTIRAFEMRFWQVSMIFDLIMLRTLASIFTVILPIAMGACLLIRGAKMGLYYRSTPIKCGVLVIVMVLLAWLFLWLIQDLPRIHLDISPSLWSDFGYWGDFLNRNVFTLSHMFQGEWREPERIAITNLGLSMKYGIIATGIFVTFIRNIKVENWAGALFYCSCSILTAFLVIVTSGNNDFSGLASLWWLSSFYLVLSTISVRIMDGELLTKGKM